MRVCRHAGLRAQLSRALRRRAPAGRPACAPLHHEPRPPLGLAPARDVGTVVPAAFQEGQQLTARQERDAEQQDHKTKVEDIKRAAEQAAREAQEEARAASQSDAAGAAGGGVDTGELRQTLGAAIQHLQAGLVERDTEVRLMLLAALGGEHILFIGPPGTAKSELGRRLAFLYQGRFFERLLTRFSVPEELFGPLSMRALEADQYVRQTAGYLPDASVAFIDEIFKANSAILNTLLTVLNERLFDNGSERVRVPLVCLVGASNELPESEELDALYDRFLLRRQVAQVSPSGLGQLLAAADAADASGLQSAEAAVRGLQLPQDLFLSVRREAAARVSVPDEVKQLVVDLRSYLQEKCEPPVYVSDRRLVKAIQLMKVAAYTSGRSAVSLHDCLLLQHMLWQRPDESVRIADFVLGQLASDEKTLEQANYLFKGMFARACQTASTKAPADELLRDVGAMRAMLCGKLAAVYAGADGRASGGAASLWTSEEEAEAVAAAVAPKLAKAQEAVERLLFEVVTLQVALQEPGTSTVALADCLPRYWGSFVRDGSFEDAQKLGTRRAEPHKPPRMALGPRQPPGTLP